MTDYTKPKKHPPEYYAQGLHLTPEERRERFNEMQQRLEALEAAKEIDTLKPMPPDVEVATPLRLEKAADDFEEFISDTGKRTLRMLDGSILDRLFSKSEKHPITGEEYAAGRQIQEDWDKSMAGKIGSVDTTRDAVDGGLMKDMTAAAIDAFGRYKRAIKKVGPKHAHVLEQVLIYEMTLEEYGQRYCFHSSRKLAKVAAKEALRRALYDLAFHYFGKRQANTVAAHAPGYRPKISPADERI